jgi:hypothetical protein
VQKRNNCAKSRSPRELALQATIGKLATLWLLITIKKISLKKFIQTTSFVEGPMTQGSH